MERQEETRVRLAHPVIDGLWLGVGFLILSVILAVLGVIIGLVFGIAMFG